MILLARLLSPSHAVVIQEIYRARVRTYVRTYVYLYVMRAREQRCATRREPRARYAATLIRLRICFVKATRFLSDTGVKLSVCVREAEYCKNENKKNI